MALNDFNHIKDVITALDTLKPSRFGYRQEVLDAPAEDEVSLLTGVYAVEDTHQVNSIPTPEQVAMTDVVTAVGLRTQAATLSRMMINHFFGRMSLNMVKLTEKVKLLVSDHLVNRYITPSGKVTEDITVSLAATKIDLIQNQSPLAAAEPTTAPLTITLPAAVNNGNAGVMTGADKKVLDDTASGLSTLNGAAVKLTGDQTVAGRKTFSTNPRSSATQGTDVTDLTRKDYVDGQINTTVKLTGNQTIAGVKTLSSIPVLPASDPTTDNQAARKKYVDDAVAGASAIPMSYLDTDATMAANSDDKVPSQKAVKSFVDANTKYTNILFNSLRHIESWCTLGSPCQDDFAEGGDYAIMGGPGGGVYWRSYRGATPQLKSTASTGHFDTPGKAVWAGNNKWFLGFRGNGLWRTDDMSATTPIFVNCLVGTGDFRFMKILVENEEQVIYAIDFSARQFVKITNNGATKTVIFTSANQIVAWAKCGDIIVVQSSTTIEYSPNNGVNWYNGSITLSGGRLMSGSRGIAVFKGAFFITTGYNNVAPQIFRSLDGNTWTVVYTGEIATYSSGLQMQNIDDKFLIWTEGNTAGGYRFVYSFHETLAVIEPAVSYSTVTYPVYWGFFEDTIMLLGSGATPTLWRSPIFVK